MMEECTTTTTITTCKEGEACVTYINNDKERSAPIQGCFPLNSSLPFLGPAPLLSSPVCEMQDVGTVSFCICTSSGCNDQGVSLEKSRQQPRQPRDAASREPKNFIFPFANSSTVAKIESREGRQRRLKCYSCGSLFNRDSPQCAEFNPGNGNQVMTCNEGEACMLYTWKKSRTEIGSYRECFSTSILLGHPDYPITPRPTCSLSRTQQDTRSSIRACLCTQDFCNNVQDVVLRNLWTEDNPSNSLPSSQSDDFQPVLNDQGGVKKVEGEVKVQLGKYYYHY